MILNPINLILCSRRNHEIKMLSLRAAFLFRDHEQVVGWPVGDE
jgi:hypothetical protein